MAGVELATAYVALTVSAKGIKGAIEDEIGQPLEQSAKKSGDKSGNAFSKEFAEKVKDGIGKAGIGLGLALSKGYVDNLSIEKGNDKLAAQLGLVGDQAESAGKAAGSLYSQAYGESLGQVNEAIKGVQQNIEGFRGASAKDLEGVTAKVLAVADAFDQDLNAVTAAAGQLMRTGLAKDADEALDVITKGFQSGTDKAGDLLDTFNEYGTQFRKLGLDARTATGILSQGLKAGARDADIVADVLKEFSIRAVDGTDAVAAGFDSLGLSGKAMASAIAGGGPSAANALQVTLDRLRAIKDPTLQAQAAVALFGTQAEDLGAALFAIDPRTAVAALGDVTGAAKDLDTQLSGNTATSFEKFKRTAELAFAGVADKIGPVLSIAPALGGLAQVTDTLGPAMSRAAKGVKSLVGEVGLLKAGLVTGGLTAAVAAIGFGFSEWAKAGARAQQVVGDLTKDVKTNDLASYAAAVDNLSRRNQELAQSTSGKELGTGFLSGLKELSGLLPFVSEDLARTRRTMDETANTADDLTAAQARLSSNVGYFRDLLHLTDEDVLRLANSAGVDLATALDSKMVFALQNARGEIASATVKSNDLAAAQGLLASKVTTAAEKLDAFKASLDAALGPQVSAYEATTRLAGTTAALAEAYAAAKGTADLNTESGRNLRDALAGQVSAIGAQITALIESGGLTADATARTNDYIAKLEALKRQYPALSGQVDEFIARLREIPPTTTAEVKVDATQAHAELDRLRAVIKSDLGGLNVSLVPLPGRAAGGPVSAGRAYLVGEDRPELFVPRTSGEIIPEEPTGGVGPMIENVNVDARGIPQVDALAEYVGRNVGWRVGPSGRR